MPLSSLWGLRLPALTGSQPDVPKAVADLAADLESTLGGRGLWTDKPAPGKPGRRWVATDLHVEAVDTGTDWLIVGPAEVGDYKLAARTADHNGWVRCDGRELAATYTDLVALLNGLGRPFGTGPAGRPKLPDPAGRVPVLSGSGTALTPRNIGDTFGTETHALTIAQMPQHAHGVNDPGHSHSVDGAQNPNTKQGVAGGGGESLIPSSTTLGTSSNGTGISIVNAGSGQAHPNTPPSLVVGSLFIRA